MILVVLVRPEHEAGVAMRTQPHRGADDAIEADMDRCKTDSVPMATGPGERSQR